MFHDRFGRHFAAAQTQKRAVATVALAVEPAGQALLARAFLAAQEHRVAGIGGLGNLAQDQADALGHGHGLHRGRLGRGLLGGDDGRLGGSGPARQIKLVPQAQGGVAEDAADHGQKFTVGLQKNHGGLGQVDAERSDDVRRAYRGEALHMAVGHGHGDGHADVGQGGEFFGRAADEVGMVLDVLEDERAARPDDLAHGDGGRAVEVIQALLAAVGQHDARP